MRQYPFELPGLEIRVIVGYMFTLMYSRSFPSDKGMKGRAMLHEWLSGYHGSWIKLLPPLFCTFSHEYINWWGSEIFLWPVSLFYKMFAVMSQLLSEQMEWMFTFYQLSDDPPRNWFKSTSFRLWLNLSLICTWNFLGFVIAVGEYRKHGTRCMVRRSSFAVRSNNMVQEAAVNWYRCLSDLQAESSVLLLLSLVDYIVVLFVVHL